MLGTIYGSSIKVLEKEIKDRRYNKKINKITKKHVKRDKNVNTFSYLYEVLIWDIEKD